MKRRLILLKMKSELWFYLLHFTSWILIFVFFFSPFCSFSFFKYLNVIHQFWVLILNMCVEEGDRWKLGRRRTMNKLLVLLGWGGHFYYKVKVISDIDMNET